MAVCNLCTNVKGLTNTLFNRLEENFSFWGGPKRKFLFLGGGWLIVSLYTHTMIIVGGNSSGQIRKMSLARLSQQPLNGKIVHKRNNVCQFVFSGLWKCGEM